MQLPRILIHLDTDQQPSVFDAVVALDSGIDHLLQYSAVSVDNVVGLVHGAMFTRGPEQLRNTAIFVGGSRVADGERLVAAIRSAFFGPIRVSVMLDSNGANTTAAAAVLCAARHLPLQAAAMVVLGGTGPVGQRVARLLLDQGASVRLVSRQAAKAREGCAAVAAQVDPSAHSRLAPLGMDELISQPEHLAQAVGIIACGAAGVKLLSAEHLAAATRLQVAIDLNAVPPAGLEGIAASDKAVSRGNRVDYGAIGVGGLKMKIHRGCVERLFGRNDQVLDAAEILAVGHQLEAAS